MSCSVYSVIHCMFVEQVQHFQHTSLFLQMVPFLGAGNILAIIIYTKIKMSQMVPFLRAGHKLFLKQIITKYYKLLCTLPPITKYYKKCTPNNPVTCC